MPPPIGTALTCPGCGAALKLKGTPTVVACRYCGAHIHTSLGTRTDQPAEAVASKQLATALVAMIVIVPIFLTITIAVVVLVFAASDHSSRQPPQVTVEQTPPNMGGVPVTVGGGGGAPTKAGMSGKECKKGSACPEGEVCLITVAASEMVTGTCMDAHLCAFARSQQPKQISCRDRKWAEAP